MVIFDGGLKGGGRKVLSPQGGVFEIFLFPKMKNQYFCKIWLEKWVCIAVVDLDKYIEDY